ncbi:ef-hand superfamily Ca2+-modulated protein [Xylogone sp. PMI_703]|nr:ef-hand superfamily Ca2+-modulated protein [Xylogone sp. PMI_703]
MPPKRRAQSSADPGAPKARQSKLAKEHNITAAEENEIKEAFGLFSIPMSGEKDGVIPIQDVRRAMIALDIHPSPSELAEFISILDPDGEGYAIYSSFLAICALKFHSRTRTSESHTREVDEAFRLFTTVGAGGAEEEKITLASLKRVARALREDVEEDLLRDMILEANGGVGVARGVNKEEFEGVMRRAGVWR